MCGYVGVYVFHNSRSGEENGVLLLEIDHIPLQRDSSTEDSSLESPTDTLLVLRRESTLTRVNRGHGPLQ